MQMMTSSGDLLAFNVHQRHDSNGILIRLHAKVGNIHAVKGKCIYTVDV